MSYQIHITKTAERDLADATDYRSNKKAPEGAFF